MSLRSYLLRTHDEVPQPYHTLEFKISLDTDVSTFTVSTGVVFASVSGCQSGFVPHVSRDVCASLSTAPIWLCELAEVDPMEPWTVFRFIRGSDPVSIS